MTGLVLGPEEFTPIPYIERCDYNDFLAALVKRHGPEYLQRPDGSLLDGVVTMPKIRSKHQPKRQMPTLPPSYTGNPMDDFQPQLRGIQVMVEYQKPNGNVTIRREYSCKNLVLAALKDGPKTVAEIAKTTGLTLHQVDNAISRYKGKLIEAATELKKYNRWQLIVGEPPPPPPPSDLTIRERIELHIAQNGPSSSSDLSQALGVKRDTIYTTCHTAATLAVVGKLNDKVVLWGLVKDKP